MLIFGGGEEDCFYLEDDGSLLKFLSPRFHLLQFPLPDDDINVDEETDNDIDDDDDNHLSSSFSTLFCMIFATSATYSKNHGSHIFAFL